MNKKISQGYTLRNEGNQNEFKQEEFNKKFHKADYIKSIVVKTDSVKKADFRSQNEYACIISDHTFDVEITRINAETNDVDLILAKGNIIMNIEPLTYVIEDHTITLFIDDICIGLSAEVNYQMETSKVDKGVFTMMSTSFKYTVFYQQLTHAIAMFNRKEVEESVVK